MLFFAFGVFLLSVGGMVWFPEHGFTNKAFEVMATFAGGLIVDGLYRLRHAAKLIPRLAWLWISGKKLRISTAYLIRVKGDSKYLLVFSNKAHVWVAPGGVYKFSRTEIRDRFNFQDDTGVLNAPIDDMRVTLPSKSVFNLLSFLKWFETQRERELGPHREFDEELIQSGILNSNIFKNPKFEFLRRECYFNYSVHFKITEYRIFDVFTLVPTDNQKAELNRLATNPPRGTMFVSADEIETRRSLRNGTEIKIGDNVYHTL